MRRVRDDLPVPAVVFRADEYGALGAPVHCLDDDGTDALGARSRHCQSITRWASESATTQDTVDFLLQFAKRFSTAPVLLPTYDYRNLELDAHRSVLSTAYRLPQPRQGALQRLYSKTGLDDVLRETGLPGPACHLPQDTAEAMRLADGMRFPVVLKAVDPDRLMERTGLRLAIVARREDFADCFRTLHEDGAPNLLLQEFVHGPSWALAGYVGRDGRLQFAATGRKLRQLPVDGGITALAVSEENPVLVEYAQRLADHTGYRGAMGLDFTLDERDGHYKLLDFNVRLGANFRAFQDINGMDAARAWYLDMIDQPLAQRSTTRPGRRWAVEHKLFDAAQLLQRRGDWSVMGAARAAAGVDEWAHSDCRDTGPTLRYWRRTLQARLRRR